MTDDKSIEELVVLQQIREAAGDDGKLMQPELVAHIKNMYDMVSSPKFGMALVMAARYAHSRDTGAALQVIETIKQAWPFLSARVRAQLLEEAKNEAVHNRDEWESLRIFALSNDQQI